VTEIHTQATERTYIDLFSGCGGLSLGLGQAGWKGLFAVEKDAMAFETFKHNMIEGVYSHFEWPSWLPKQPSTVQDILSNYSEELFQLKGKVDLIAGGPPCQGFSLAGMRNAKDPRNKLSREYIKMVEIIQPKYLLLENVRGFATVFKNAKGSASKIPYSETVKIHLQKQGYKVFSDIVCSDQFGVPQSRSRFIMFGIRSDIAEDIDDPFKKLKEIRTNFLKQKGLPLTPVSVKEAISDLEVMHPNVNLLIHSGPKNNSFMQLDYTPVNNFSAYQKLMRKGVNKKYKPNSLRLARHKSSTVEKFKKIQEISRPGISLNTEQKASIGMKKQVICVLNPFEPSKTLTTLPDDLLHYSEPRILTVRENARIQSFPDNFSFKGKYTTGGNRRTKECPRYTQVGNAVPPLLAEALGTLMIEVDKSLVNQSSHYKNDPLHPQDLI
jgi:DNA (cytosine-5)-methyltransferase 1